MRLGNRTRKVVLFGATALALAGIGVTTAQAVEVKGKSQSISTKYGFSKFTHKGEYLYAGDERKDGLAVYTELRWGGELKGLAHASGKGNWENQPIKVPEGENVVIRQCIWKGDTKKKCSGWQNGRA